MGVDPQHRRRVIADPLRRDLHRHAGRQQRGRVTVSSVVEPDRRQVDPGLSSGEPDMPSERLRDRHRVPEPAGQVVEGVDNIAAHITQVHDDLIAGKGLTFTYDQAVEAGDALLLRWSMLTPAGDIAGRGADIVFRDANGRATTVYMFMGIN